MGLFTVKQRLLARANTFWPAAVTEVTLSASPSATVGQKGLTFNLSQMLGCYSEMLEDFQTFVL